MPHIGAKKRERKKKRTHITKAEKKRSRYDTCWRRRRRHIREHKEEQGCIDRTWGNRLSTQEQTFLLILQLPPSLLDLKRMIKASRTKTMWCISFFFYFLLLDPPRCSNLKRQRPPLHVNRKCAHRHTLPCNWHHCNVRQERRDDTIRVNTSVPRLITLFTSTFTLIDLLSTACSFFFSPSPCEGTQQRISTRIKKKKKANTRRKKSWSIA